MKRGMKSKKVWLLIDTDRTIVNVATTERNAIKNLKLLKDYYVVNCGWSVKSENKIWGCCPMYTFENWKSIYIKQTEIVSPTLFKIQLSL